MSEIKYLKNDEIDPIMWDRCIARSHNGNVFGYSWFLDSVCNTWDAIVLGNYNAVMPLPVKKNLIFKHISLPDFLIKTNLYQAKEFDPEVYKDFINKYKPKLAVSGHIHETQNVDELYGSTLISNPGPYGKIFEVV